MSELIAGRLAIGGELHEGYVEVDGDRIASVGQGGPPREPDLRHEGVVAPGFVDLQVNGAGGHEVADGPEALDAIDAVQLEHGVTGYLATLISPDQATMERVLPELERRAADPDSPLVGVHVEGPWIAREFAGMHPLERIQPVPDEVPEWVRSPAVSMVTLAPELPGAVQLIADLTRLGVMVSLGHSAATSFEGRAATDAGAEMVTHLFNAMHPITAREPRLAGGALTDERLRVSLIADSVHVVAPALELARRAAGDRVILVSDSSPAAGAPAGHYELAGVAIERGEDGSVRTSNGRLAGSSVTVAEAMRHWANLTSATLAEAIRAASEVPGAAIGRRVRLEAGAPADIVLVNERSATVERVMRRGRWLDQHAPPA
jgi:N-acetylglucosamine-6-phosphate deacetylase